MRDSGELCDPKELRVTEGMTEQEFQARILADQTLAKADYQVSEWRPIETAPKDGTEVLVYVEVATVPVAHIAFYRSAEQWETEGQYCGGWDSVEEWEGWWSYVRHSVTQEKLDDITTPTHWMPLPSPP